MATDSNRELIAVERKSCNLTQDSLLNDNDNIQSLLSGFDIEKELSIVLSEEKVSFTEEKNKPVFCGKLYFSNKNQLKILEEEMGANL